MMNGSASARGIYLRVIRKLYIVPVCMVILALLFFGGYRLWLKIADRESYVQVSKLYINFTRDFEGNVQDYYNGATWTDLLTAHPKLLGGIAGSLDAEENEARDLVKQCVTAEILTDIRLMTLTVTAGEPELAERLTAAVCDSLTAFGSGTDGFDSIELLSVEPVKRVVLDDRSRNAALLGAFLGLVFSALGLYLYEAMRLAVYVPEEAEELYGYRCAGGLMKEGTENKSDKSDAAAAVENGLMEVLKNTDPAAAAFVSEAGVDDAQKFAERAASVCGSPVIFRALSLDDHDAVSRLERVFVVLHSGANEGARVKRALSLLSLGKFNGVCHLITVIADADPNFVRRYYAS